MNDDFIRNARRGLVIAAVIGGVILLRVSEARFVGQRWNCSARTADFRFPDTGRATDLVAISNATIKPHSRGEFLSWTPNQIEEWLGPPQRTSGPLKGLFPIDYQGISFIFKQSSVRDEAPIDSVAFHGQELSETARKAAWLIPSGLELHCTTGEAQKALGHPNSIESKNIQGIDYVWLSYFVNYDDWREYWLRFEDGRLTLINIKENDQSRGAAFGRNQEKGKK